MNTNIEERIEKQLKKANVAFTIADLPNEFDERTRMLIKGVLDANERNEYDYIAKLLLVCGRMEEALNFLLDDDLPEELDGITFTDPEARDASVFYEDEEIPEDVLKQIFAEEAEEHCCKDGACSFA
jgi:hypothetical protein